MCNFPSLLERLRNDDPSLTELEFSYLDQGGPAIDSDGVQQLCQALQSNSRVTRLYIGGVDDMDQSTFEGLSDMLTVNRSIQQLIFDDNRVDSEGAKLIARSLMVNTTLQYLNLDSNDIGLEGIRSLFKALTVNTSLQILSIDMDYICSQGIFAIAGSLVCNTALKEVDIGTDHELDIESIKALWALLQFNTTLTKFDALMDYSWARKLMKENEAIDHSLQGATNTSPGLLPLVLANTDRTSMMYRCVKARLDLVVVGLQSRPTEHWRTRGKRKRDEV